MSAPQGTDAPNRPADAAGVMAIADIVIGKRHRKDMGDVAGLAASIGELELLQPIVVGRDRVLKAGARRLAAYKLLGRTEIPVTISDADTLRAEHAENAVRLNFSPSEAVSMMKDLEPFEKAAARERMARGGKGAQVGQPSRSADKVASFTGYGRTTLDKAAQLVAAGQAEPARYGKLVADMDRTGRVNGPYRRLQNMRQAAAIRAEPPPWPQRGP